MAKIQELFDRTTGEAIYPRTAAQAVYDSEGRDLETRLAAEEVKTDEKLGQYTKTDALTKQLAAKQDALTVSADLELTPEGALSLTDAAKREALDDMWILFGGTVIEPGKLYGLNGLSDIIYTEVIRILSLYPLSSTGIPVRTAMFMSETARTLFPIWMPEWADCDKMFMNMSSVEVLSFEGGRAFAKNWARAFEGCKNLKSIQGDLLMDQTIGIGKIGGMFRGCVQLAEIRLLKLKGDLDLSDCPLLSIASIEYMVSNAANTTAITVTVHADVFAKLTGDTTNEAAAALTEEELAQWEQVLTDALEKNITFATI